MNFGQIIYLILFSGILAGNTSKTGDYHSESISFSKDIFPLIEKACSDKACHGDAQVPKLTEYKKIRKFSQRIKFRITFEKAPMPPINAEESLNKEEIDKIISWIDQGAKNN